WPGVARSGRVWPGVASSGQAPAGSEQETGRKAGTGAPDLVCAPADDEEDRMRVALFATCLVDTLVPRVARATAVLLERLGHEVVVPRGQACCGQMHVNTGYRREAVPVVANHVRAFA